MASVVREVRSDWLGQIVCWAQSSALCDPSTHWKPENLIRFVETIDRPRNRLEELAARFLIIIVVVHRCWSAELTLRSISIIEKEPWSRLPTCLRGLYSCDVTVQPVRDVFGRSDATT